MATNKPVKITDSKSGIIRRLIDVKPSGRLIPRERYDVIKDQVDFELGHIAWHCLDVFQKLGTSYYDRYIPIDMLFQTDPFFNFVEAYAEDFLKEEYVSLARAYTLYKNYCDESLVEYKLVRYKFREELKTYFREFYDRTRVDGKQVRSVYSGFRLEKFPNLFPEQDSSSSSESLEAQSCIDISDSWIDMSVQESIFDKELAECPAQYATDKEAPRYKWSNVTTKLSDIDTSELHYVKPEESMNLIMIDFDLRNESGEKDYKLNFEAASKWPKTYCELSKGGSGIHLHYYYDGDVGRLAPLYSDGIEIKVFKGGSSIRRRLSQCNDIPIARISSGLPLKEKKVINKESVKTEKSLRDLISRNLRKEIHPGTKPSIDFIKKILDDAYDSGLHYDVSDMRNKTLIFALHSTNHSEYCVKLVNEMKFRSIDISEAEKTDEPIVFYDVEVFPNLFLINYKFEGPDKVCIRMINPSPEEVGTLFKYKLVGFNCRRYDNHILYARYMGYSNRDLYELSQRIVGGSTENCFFGEAYNISYTDVLDFSSKKQSLKKFEIELGIHHKELGLPWDQPVPEEQWPLVAEYCDNDVIATEAVFNARSADWTARQILADIAGMTVNDTTNQLTTRIIFGKEKNPQKEFNYRNMGIENDGGSYTRFDELGRPLYPGYKYDHGVSTYRGETVGEGGYVYSVPGMYTNVALLDIASMHPSSIVAEKLFGERYTERFSDILNARIAIKHKDFDRAKQLFDGKLAPYLEDESMAKNLAQALKIAINSVYGLTSARFTNPFRDNRNIDNIVAKRGALFMINLKHEVLNRGFKVAHIKTDSIKIPNATPEIIQFVMDYGKQYGYNFEHEATYERMCLVNDAVYIARYDNGEWTATGAQFQQPYVFKTLFSKEPLVFKDLCEAKSVTSTIYLDMNEDLGEDEHCYVFIGKTGLFSPILPGKGGGELMREKDGKYYSVTGTKGHRWLETEQVTSLYKEGDIDMSYYDEMANEAIKTISRFGDFDSFASGGPVNAYLSEDAPPWGCPCGETKYTSCLECPKYQDNECASGYNIENCLFDRR